MSRKDDLRRLIANHTRRLQKLKERQALQGLSIEPAVLIEIEDIEAEIARLQLELEQLGGATESSIQKTRSVPQINHKKSHRAPNEFLADFVIVTALEEERDAVLDKLPGYQKLNPTEGDIRVYYQADISVIFPDGSQGSYRVIVISLLGMGRVQATITTADAIRRWQPRCVMLVGIAGGVSAETVNLGDILISDQIVDYELQKLTTTGPQMRWQVHLSSSRLREAARNFSQESWRRLMKISRPTYGESKRHIGPIASGDKVIASSEVLKILRAGWPKLIGVEMEGSGVAVAAFQAAKPPEFFMVRGVSDLADEEKGSPDVERWRTYACDVAASYAIGLLQTGPVLPASPGKSAFANKIKITGLKKKRPNLVAVVKEKFSESAFKAEFPYGMMPPNSEFYLERKADQECWKEISQSRSVTLYIQAPRQMGKSSLMYRIIDRAKKGNHREFAFVDFQMLPERYLKDDKIFFKEFCRLISASLA